MNDTAAVIVAAGNASRMRLGYNKNFLECSGRLLVSYTLEAFARSSLVDRIILVVKDSERTEALRAAAEAGVAEKTALASGGDTRQQSVFNGLCAAGKGTGFAAVHDGARCLITTEDIDRVLSKAYETGAATAAARMNDTCAVTDTAGGTIAGYADRESLCLIQTPQCFRYDDILYAHNRAMEDGVSGTDDTGLYHRYCGSVSIVYTKGKNMKITEPGDLPVAEALLYGNRQR